MRCDICDSDEQYFYDRDHPVLPDKMYCPNCHCRWLWPGLLIEWDLSRIEELLEAQSG